MRSARLLKWLRVIVPGCLVLQITACLGPDPEFFVSNLAASTLVSEIVSLLFSLATGALALAAAGG